MDQDSESNFRFCWPPKDRARARSFPPAPRIPPAFTASVSFGPAVPVSGSHRFARCAWPAPAELGWSALARAGTGELVVGCCLTKTPGRLPPFQVGSPPLPRLIVPPAVTRGVASVWAGGVALGQEGATAHWVDSVMPKNSDGYLSDPDWRMMGEQDLISVAEVSLD